MLFNLSCQQEHANSQELGDLERVDVSYVPAHEVSGIQEGMQNLCCTSEVCVSVQQRRYSWLDSNQVMTK